MAAQSSSSASPGVRICSRSSSPRSCSSRLETLCAWLRSRFSDRRRMAASAVLVVLAFRRPLPVIARDERDDFDFFGFEAAEVAVLDQIVRVLVVILVADVNADVVEDPGVLEPLAFAIGEPVERARLIEERQREARDLVRVLRPEVAALGEFEHAAPANIGIAIRLRDLFAVARDVVEDEAF